MENLEDFRYYFTDEKEIDAFVATEEALKDPEQRLQVAKERRVWTAVRQNGLRKENRNTVSSVAELDDLLEEGTLREVKVQFWKRYKVKYPVEVSPSDQLLSRSAATGRWKSAFSLSTTYGRSRICSIRS